MHLVLIQINAQCPNATVHRHQKDILSFAMTCGEEFFGFFFFKIELIEFDFCLLVRVMGSRATRSLKCQCNACGVLLVNLIRYSRSHVIVSQ